MALPAPTLVDDITGYIPAGRRRYVWAPTIANVHTPTTSEISAGQDLTPWVIQDGVSGFSTTGATVDDPRMDTVQTRKVPGLVTSDDSSIRFNASTDSTDVRQLLTRDLTGFMLIFPEGIATDATMSVFPVTVTSSSLENASGADIAAVLVGFAITGITAENITIPSA